VEIRKCIKLISINKKMPKMEITELQREDEKSWDSYVHKSSTSTFYHQLRSVLIKLFKSLMLEKRG